MKVIFLDIDGVLTTVLWASNFSEFNPVCTNALLKLLDADPDVRIVISSTWRGGMDQPMGRLKEQLEKYSLDKRLHEDWRTIRMWDSKRGVEIREWLSRHPEVEAE